MNNGEPVQTPQVVQKTRPGEKKRTLGSPGTLLEKVKYMHWEKAKTNPESVREMSWPNLSKYRANLRKT